MNRDVWTGPILFGTCVILGMAFIVIAKLSNWPAWLVTSVPILVMCAYAAATLLPALRLRDDQTGDNLYYMGFLFTLASLGVSLYQFSAEGSAEQIVQSFGIAIGSTIAGVALRVFFAQMRRDPVDIEREARLELAEAARRVRGELDGIVMEMSSFQRATTQVVHDGFNTVQANVDRISQDLIRTIQKTVEDTRAPIIEASRTSADAVVGMGKSTAARLDEMASSIGAKLDASAIKLAAENDRVGSSAAHVAEALDALVSKLMAMQTPDKVIEMKLDPLLKPLIKASTDANRRSEQAVLGFERQQDRIDRLADQMQKIASQIENASAQLAQEQALQKEAAGELRAVGRLLAEVMQKQQNGLSDNAIRDLERGIANAIRSSFAQPLSTPEDTPKSDADILPDKIGD